MPLKPTNNSLAEIDPALDQSQLYALGLDDVRRFSRQLWTDHNTHDPGITILELLCYALTDLSYRAQFPLEDLLATPTDNAQNMASQFFTARQVLPNRPLTVADYRKLLIDLPEVRNAWISPHPLRYFADTIKKRLWREDPDTPGIRPVDVHGLYDVRLEFMDEVTTTAQREAVIVDAMQVLQANRNLCEDFVSIDSVVTQPYSLCAEIELTPDADAIEVAAQLAFQVDQCLAPPIFNYTLAEMLAKPHRDGSARTADEIFDGPLLRHGFIDDRELAEAELKSEVRLSDVISVIMDIDGVRAVREIVMNEIVLDQDGQPVQPPQFKPPETPWRLKVPEGRQPRLSDEHGRLVFYKRHLPIPADAEKVKTRLDELRLAVRARLNKESAEDLPIPLGRHRQTTRYHSFQHHFPEVYGLSDAGLPGKADEWRRAQALQLKGYLLFFDQVLANFLAQLAQSRELFSRKPGADRTYFAQIVDSIPGYEQLYPKPPFDPDALAALLETPEAARQRRSRFLDHLLARCAEDFHDYVNITGSMFGLSEQDAIAVKQAFLNECPRIGSERGLAYNRVLAGPGEQWNSRNVSGLERRLARLLGISDYSRRNLAEVDSGEGMYLIENILLRPASGQDGPFLPICVDPACTDCADDDPYSYRVHFILPAYAGRFQNMDFRRFVEETIRQETPAHILPKVCWANAEQMAALQTAYHDWIEPPAGATPQELRTLLEAFVKVLFEVKNVFPQQELHDCGGDDKSPPFILGRTQLGSSKKSNTPIPNPGPIP